MGNIIVCEKFIDTFKTIIVCEKFIDTFKAWDCNLEKEAKALLGSTCRDDEPKAPKGRTGVFSRQQSRSKTTSILSYDSTLVGILVPITKRKPPKRAKFFRNTKLYIARMSPRGRDPSPQICVPAAVRRISVMRESWSISYQLMETVSARRSLSKRTGRG
ncbi:hypothetical protein Y032_0045g1192 [Ancylostoma ceylanicum]|uniref:Uncharacterized protein n=1 Tax=Ancylostoma ceylanicum TaxID=53326 RepID=A0A016UDI6_9BILA|nr:hypothetical protein Y032_0045g1192 [Ancylostoma ceylanicum]